MSTIGDPMVSFEPRETERGVHFGQNIIPETELARMRELSRKNEAEEAALNKKYYDVLKATEGFYMGDLKKLTKYQPLDEAVSKFSKEDVDVIGCARFALNHLNKEQEKDLKFVRLVGVNGQIKIHVMYWMTIEASDGNFYEAKVHDRTPFGGLELFFIRPAVHYPPRSDDELSLLGASTCSESDFAPLSEDYGCPSLRHEIDKSVEDMMGGSRIEHGIDPYEDLDDVASWKYFKVMETTEHFYVGDASKFTVFPPPCMVIPMGTDNPRAIELARLALDVLNKEQGMEVELVRLVGVNGQLVCGLWYWITLEASNGKFYEAKLYDDILKEEWDLEFIRHAVHYPSQILYYHAQRSEADSVLRGWGRYKRRSKRRSNWALTTALQLEESQPVDVVPYSGIVMRARD